MAICCSFDNIVFNFLLDFTFDSWKTKNKYTVMEDYSIARLEEELGMHGYLYNSSQVCDRSSGVFTSPSAGWTNGGFYIYKNTLFSFNF